MWGLGHPCGGGPRQPGQCGHCAGGKTFSLLAHGKPSGLGGPEGRERLCVSDALGDPGDAWLSPHRQR